ncbi:MAG: carboxypeptidase regulatory-like domain-containing protein [Candidatus Sulfotelmatobacter sp.]
MKSQVVSRFAALCLLALFTTFISYSIAALAQTLTSGDVGGTVLDPTGAAVPNATVTLSSKQTGANQTATTNATGAFRFSLLNPGQYTVTANASGFQNSAQNTVAVTVGQTIDLTLKLTVAATKTTVVEVTAGGNAVQTENGNVSTNISPEQIANIPNPGNDLTYYVQTAPGATMNTQAGYGNSATFGISGTSNLFTIDGMNENDPFLNLSNSGASNLLLGSNDVNEATVVNNGYSGQYGSLAGANVNYVTKSGGNTFHGNVEYFWNGRVLNANDWFNVRSGTPRPFDNDNQWAASIGGPIVKNKTFFFVDTEGLRLLIPTVGPVNVPTSAFESATIANLTATGNAAEIPFYNQIFSIYNNASGYGRATPLPDGGGTGCDGGVALPGAANCVAQFQASLNNLSTEWLLTGRVDQVISNKDRAFVHFRTDHGLQATFTDPLTATLNTSSIQPEYDGQFQENHTFGNSAINQLIIAGSWYSAVFAPPNLGAAQALTPYELLFSGGEFNTPGGPNYSTWPQGRNVTQYQVSDDYSWVKGNHNLKFGIDFRRNDITDYTPGGFNTAVPTAIFNSLASFYGGTTDEYVQGFATRPTEPLALYSLGLYAQDEFAVRPNLKLTLSLRAEHNSNPVCQTNCFARLTSSFADISHDPSQPYNAAIRTGLNQALPNYQNIAWEPRFGFAWQPLGVGKTVVRGGIGIFADIFPGTIATSFDTNSPLKNTFVVPGAMLAPGFAGSAQTIATASNAAFLTGFYAGQDLSQILRAAPLFTPPEITNAANNIHYPTYDEWNFEIQQPIGSTMSFSLNYVGNHGSYLALLDPALNAYCGSACLTGLGISSFAGLPAAPLDSRFSTVSEASNPGVSNYNGVTVEFTRHMSKSLQVQASYTWSHALDDISNGGFLPFNFDTNTSILAPQDPYDLKLYNYGNADYDRRHQFTANYVYTTPHLSGAKGVLLDWTISGTFFAYSGLPFTVIDGADTSTLGAYNYGPALGLDLFASSAVGPISCGRSAAITPCLSSSEFFSAIGPGGLGSFGTQRRNQVYGPGFFDTDLSVLKTFHVPHWESAQFQVGAQAFNVLNHPNFDQPIGDIANPQFGSIVRTVGPPTSIFGSFLGGDASPRALQIKAQIQF